MSLNFRQTWTGEPHTVTGGTLVDEAIRSDLLKFVEAFENLAGSGVPLPNPDGEVPEGTTVADVIELVEESDESADRTNFLEAYEALIEDEDFPTREEANDVSFVEFVEEIDPKIEEAFSSLPFAFNEETGGLAQNVGQPCFLGEGRPPEDPDEPCDEQDQPEFDGTQTYFSSGIIPYEGAQGNTFNVKLADDIDPGTYNFYCAVHGFLQSTEVEVRPEGSDIPSQEEVNQQVAREIDEASKPVEELYQRAIDDNEITVVGEEGDQTVEGPFSGLYTPQSDHVLINEFVPKNLEVEAGEPITWKLMGVQHTISFGVPDYFPIIEFQDNGNVRLNPRLEQAAGGAKKAPEFPDDSPPALKFDAGTYDGSGFWSTGLVSHPTSGYVEFTMRISEPGTYDYACLIHPPMVGKVEVT
jgi:plastocyanin